MMSFRHLKTIRVSGLGRSSLTQGTRGTHIQSRGAKAGRVASPAPTRPSSENRSSSPINVCRSPFSSVIGNEVGQPGGTNTALTPDRHRCERQPHPSPCMTPSAWLSQPPPLNYETETIQLASRACYNNYALTRPPMCLQQMKITTQVEERRSIWSEVCGR